MYILNKKETKQEVELYQRNLKWNKISELIMIIASSIIIILNIWMVIEFADKLEWYKYVIICSSSGAILILFIPLIFIWYTTGHVHLQDHMPIVTNNNILDVCGILFDVINYILLIITTALTISSNSAYNNEVSDHEIALFGLLSGSIFFIWGIIVPLIQMKIHSAQEKTFEKYEQFKPELVEKYLEELKAIYPTRVKEFNERMVKEGNTLQTKNIIKRLVGKRQKFSYDTRRVFLGKDAKKHREYYMLKFCVFIDLFNVVYGDTKTKAEIFEIISKVLTKKNKKHSKNFNDRISAI